MSKIHTVTIKECSKECLDSIEYINSKEAIIKSLIDDKFKGYVRVQKTPNGYLKFGKESVGCDRVNIQVYSKTLGKNIVIEKLYKPKGDKI